MIRLLAILVLLVALWFLMPASFRDTVKGGYERWKSDREWAVILRYERAGVITINTER